MKVFDLTENEQILLWQVDILTKNFMIFSDLIIWHMGYLHEVYENVLLLNLDIPSGKYYGAMNV